MLALAVLLSVAAALQVTPDSPCADFCIDSTDLDATDPGSSTTNSSDIVCNDYDFTSEKAGKKFQRCMTCLQESKYSKGDESDLDWFLYNMRYSFDYCVFGDLNSKSLDSNPCVTSEGCGELTDVLRHDMVNTTDREQYGYCEEKNRVISSNSFDKCLACVSAESTHAYISNFLVALAIGCEQRPSRGQLLGLNETVFTKNTIQAVNPNELGGDHAANGGFVLPTTAIVGIAIGGFVLLLLASGCIYMQHRKRKNRQRASGWSFRCQARSGSLPTPDSEEEQRRAQFHAEMEQRMRTSPAERHVTGLIPDPPSSTMNNTKTKDKGITVKVTNLAQPPSLQTSGKGFHGTNSYDDFATPSSTTSIRSTNPLLRQDSPASYASRTISNSYGQAVSSSRGFSPQTPHSGVSTWEEQRPATAGRTLVGVSSVGVARQVDVRNLGAAFPPPPPPRR